MNALDTDTERTVRMFLKRLPPDLGLERAILFGSRARGEARPDSDADLALILRERGNDSEIVGILAGLAYHVYLDTDILIQPVPLALDDWLHPERFIRPGFLRSIERDGIVLW